MAKINVSSACANDFLTSLLTRLNAGSGPAKIELYTGVMPATVDTAVTSQVKLATLTCSDPAGTISDNTLTFGTITQDTAADASGTATWARFKDSNNLAVVDVDVTLQGGGGFATMVNNVIAYGVPVMGLSVVITA